MEWQKKKRNILQDVLHNDDCETVNPLGSETVVHKLGFIYFILKSLPPDLLSNLQSHFLYKSDDAKTYSIDAKLHPIVDELKCLKKDGIAVNIRDFQGVVKFTDVQVVRDNLGLNESESFSGNHVCWLCRVHRDVLKSTDRGRSCPFA